MHLGVAEGDRCAPSSLFVPPETHSMFASFNRRPLHPTSHPQRHLFGKELGSFATRPSHPGMASHSFLFSACFSRVTSTQKRPP